MWIKLSAVLGFLLDINSTGYYVSIICTILLVVLTCELIIEYLIILMICPYLTKRVAMFGITEANIKYSLNCMVVSHVYAYSPTVDRFSNLVHLYSPLGRGFELNSVKDLEPLEKVYQIYGRYNIKHLVCAKNSNCADSNRLIELANSDLLTPEVIITAVDVASSF